MPGDGLIPVAQRATTPATAGVAIILEAGDARSGPWLLDGPKSAVK